MRKLLFLSVFNILFAFNVFAQSNKLGTVSGNVNGSLGIHYGAVAVTDISIYPIGAFAIGIVGIPIDLNIGLAKPLSVGLNYSPYRWVAVGEGIVSGNISTYGINFNLYPINSNRFNMQLSLTPGIDKFKPVDIDLLYGDHIKFDLKGRSFAARLLFNIYFSDYAGLNFGLGFQTHNIWMENFDINFTDYQFENELQDLISNNFKLTMVGATGHLGVVFKLN